MTLCFTFEALDETDTDRLAATVARCLPAGTVVALVGTLGSGKTKFVERFAAHCGVVPEAVTSPTFVLLQHYAGKHTIHHFDAYRLKDNDEFLELGADELFDGDGVTMIEWADRVAECLPPNRLLIEVEETGHTSRRFVVSANSDQFTSVFQALRSELDQGSDQPTG
ncbi:MAG: tRNA (adenosine(37)-N6)-threonylcarbamoyltransferase complex ATPase subunit type 1 TsaE [Pirellulales bacterium]|nr:tRNA (adenosine(37)-N6)-threonylcarbamoyltransferase complex ATPase subunit type 1 TsaE [Planctomycetales bacterium]